jgi:adenosylcobinamide-phosphate synthase
VLIVYLTLGFRHYSHYFTSIQLALNAATKRPRALLAEWTKQDTVGMEVSEIARMAVEKSLITTHRNVFGVFFWFLMPLGPACAVMYRVAEHLARAWNEPEHMRNEAFGQFAARAFYWIDWIPVRLTAVAFAVVGNFEDAIYAWRNFAHRWSNEAIGIILSAGGGAMGVRLGTPAENAVKAQFVDATTVDVESSRTSCRATSRASAPCRARSAWCGAPVVVDAVVVAAVERCLVRRISQAGTIAVLPWCRGLSAPKWELPEKALPIKGLLI